MDEDDMRRTQFRDARLCSECIEEPDLQEFIASADGEPGCSFCECDDAPTRDFLDFMEHVRECVLEEYDLAGNWLSWESREGGWQGGSAWDTTELITEKLEIGFGRFGSENLLQAMADCLGHHDWCVSDPYGEHPLDALRFRPRIPFAPDFRAFAEAGRELSTLHLGYDTCEKYPLTTVYSGDGQMGSEHFRIGKKAMRFADESRSCLALNDLVRLDNIPAEAHGYQVNGRSPLERFIDRYRVVTVRRSGLVNDPNAWFDDPWELVAAFRRIVHVSIETVRIVNRLPEPFGASGPEDAEPA